MKEENKHGGYREGAGRIPLPSDEKKKGTKVYINNVLKQQILDFGKGESFSEKAVDLILQSIKLRNPKKVKNIRFIDLFAGLGGIRLGFETAMKKLGVNTECVLTSEIKSHAIQALKSNFEHQMFVGDICKVREEDIPEFDFLLGGFPCQAFSSAGKGLGFLDTRGTLFFEIERILKAKKPYGFILENVEGLVTHDKKDKNESIGNTLKTILHTLENLGYKTSWKVLDCQEFGVPQLRKRIFIVGTLSEYISLDNFEKKDIKLEEVLERNKEIVESHFTNCLLKSYSIEQLYGKAIKDKRGGENNIHSWSISLKGEITKKQKELMELLFKERRKKHWAEKIGIIWMDGMPLTFNQIATFYPDENLKIMLDDLVEKKYLVLEYPKNLVEKKLDDNNTIKERQYDYTKEKGYNIVAGKLSFEFTKILDNKGYAPTLVAMDVSKLGVVDGDGIRRLTLREGLRLFGYPEEYTLDEFEKSKSKAFDLLGNTVVVTVVEAVAARLGESYINRA